MDLKTTVRFKILTFYRFLIVTALKIRYGSRKYKHMHAYWPMTTIKFNENGKHDIYQWGKHVLTTCNIADLKNIANDEITIFGAGPSINKMDLSKVKDYSGIFVNGACSVTSIMTAKPLLCVIMDQYFVLYHPEMLRNLPKGTNLLLSISTLGILLKARPDMLEGYNIYIAQNILEPYFKPFRTYKELDNNKSIVSENSCFSLDPEYGLQDGGTVLTWAVQLAHFLKPKNVYIMGLDLDNAHEQHFYEDKPDPSNPNVLMSNLYTKIIPFFTLAKIAYKKSNIPIYNCSPDTALPYEIIPFSDRFLKSDLKNN